MRRKKSLNSQNKVFGIVFLGLKALLNDKVEDDSPTSSPPLDPIFTSNMQILPCSQVILIKVYVLRITICREGVELIEDQEDGTTRTFTFSGVTTSLVHLS